MKARCTRPTYIEFHLYGGLGIRVCERWNDYANFLADMGECPAGLQLDRIDSNGNYEPGNCRWVTPTVQQRNRRNNKLNADLVREIRARRSAGETVPSIARVLDVAVHNVENVVRGQVWRDVA